MPCHYVVPPILKSLASSPSSLHLLKFSFGCLLHYLPKFTVVLNREEQGEMSLYYHAGMDSFVNVI